MVKTNQNQNGYLTYGQMNLINEFRKLWADLTLFMRSYVLGSVTGIEGLTAAVSKRLYHIPEDFKIKLQPFFGVDQAEQFQQLLSMFVTYAQALITATLIDDQQAVDGLIVSLYKNVEEMADFLARINPYWSRGQWENLFYKLIEMGVAELTALKSGDYERDLQLLENISNHALTLGDYMASGVMYYLTLEDMQSQ